MARGELGSHFQKIDKLVQEISHLVPAKTPEANEFRADLAGLLVVAIAASYEACVKEILVRFAAKHHEIFGEFAGNHYRKLNSKISIGDLNGYAKLFGAPVYNNFQTTLKVRSETINRRLGQRIEDHYGNILGWRHAFAHSWARNTTVEEVTKTHRFAIRVIYSFDEAFE
jgi:RiboL-PSP-HEPN